MEVSIDINEVENFVVSEKFKNFLLDNTTDFGVAVFILQSLLDKIDEIKEENNYGN